MVKKYLELPNGIPSSDTIRLVAGNIDAAYFYQAVVQSLEGLVNDVQAAMVKKKLEKPDGKTVEEKKYYISSCQWMWNFFQKRQEGTGEWRTSSTSIWILHSGMIIIQQQKKRVQKICRC